MNVSQGVRKAAIVVANLDMGAADLLLDGMRPDEARQIRQYVVDLGPIDPDEERRVLEEFFRVTAPVANDDRAAMPGRSLHPHTNEPPHRSGGKPFRFLQQAEGEKLARILLAERPQTIALVLSHLPPEQAGAVLVKLPRPLQGEVIRRLVDLEETAPEILEEVERALESRLSEHLDMQRRRVAGVRAVAGILEAAEGLAGAQLLETVAGVDRDLAARFTPAPIDFDDLVKLDSDSLGALVESLEPETAMIALVGAPAALVERIAGLLPQQDAAAMRRQLANPGPTRLSDVEEARHEVAALANRLAVERRLRVPGKANRQRPVTSVEYLG